jgi:hypothetical protein
MKKIIILMILILIPIVSATMPMQTPFRFCERTGFKPEIQSELAVLQQIWEDTGFNMDPEQRERLESFYAMGKDCCELTVDAEACYQMIENSEKAWQRYQTNKKVRKIVYLALMVLGVVLFISPIVFLLAFHKRFKKKHGMMWLAIAAAALGFIMFLVFSSLLMAANAIMY